MDDSVAHKRVPFGVFGRSVITKFHYLKLVTIRHPGRDPKSGTRGGIRKRVIACVFVRIVGAGNVKKSLTSLRSNVSENAISCP
jgi:hypothetical protein